MCRIGKVGSGRNRGRGDEEVGRGASSSSGYIATICVALSCVKHDVSVLYPTYL